ncbi:MAG: DNA-directed RNA polymerase subunit beta [Desulfobacteraceae bacterium]|nr:MAG: DNA-directed RNA polymerase subunit beta [Desulfobacteraceae bacterium]
MNKKDSLSYYPRKSFGRIKTILDIPNLIDVQKDSYERFLQKNVLPEKRKDIGLQGAFKNVFPIHDLNKTCSLEFVRYFFEDVKHDEEECLKKGMTYEAPTKIVVQLLVFDFDEITGSKSIRDIKEQEIYFGTLPMMTERGTFIINGVERVVVSQLHRSPGAFFDNDKGKTHPSGKPLYSARIIPLRGSWIDFEFDAKDILFIRIDRRRKFPSTILLKAFGYSEEEILRHFYNVEKILIDKGSFRCVLDLNNLQGQKITEDIIDQKTGEIIGRKGERFSKKLYKKLIDIGLREIPVSSGYLQGRIAAHDIVDSQTGEVLVRTNQAFEQENLELVQGKGIGEIELLILDSAEVSTSIRDTMLLDKVVTTDDAILDIYRKLRPTSPPTQEMANVYFNNLFFNPSTYDLSQVGRLKMNYRLNQDVSLEICTLRKEDIIETVKELVRLNVKEGTVDDIDHLGNRRVRSVGELLEEEYRVGLIRMQRAIKERMTLQDVDALMPRDLVNSKPVSAVINEFFGSSQLSQFMDQTNPLSEITHKRRLSALGPGGLTRERAGFEVRDVHPSHYGRICPIETPEGPNIGLILSLSTFSRVNDFGFIETPYRKVEDGIVSANIEHLTAMDEGEYPIAQANEPLDSDGHFVRDIVAARKGGEAYLVSAKEVKYMDVSPNQLVSIAASLIPFLEHDDANRALMGSNMQRQAVPLLQAKSPLIGTGIEKVIGRHSGVAAIARRDGIVESVDASRIVIQAEKEEDGVEIYKLLKFRRSNQSTCYNQKSIVKKGDRVKKGQIIADGPAMEKGELALGRDVIVAFLSWGGYNFEDAILVSERLVREDVFTSIHIEEFSLLARDTKLGQEEITRDIPNAGEEALKELDESGIIRLGAEVRPGDVLVGKITPKGETQLSPEEKLLRAIFGEKAGDVKDTSLRVPPGVEGIVIDAKVFSRKGVEKDERTKAIQAEEISQLLKDKEDEVEVIERNAREKLAFLLEGKHLKSDLRHTGTGEILLARGQVIDQECLKRIPIDFWQGANIEAEMEVIEKMESIVLMYRQQMEKLDELFQEKIKRLDIGDELSPGVIKMVKVFVAVKRKLSVGDKMAGRHGNKGVISVILPAEDMPYFADGTPVDIVLNPLGVPSRMNVGQILETHLGWAAHELGKQIRVLVDNIKDKSLLRDKLREIYWKEYDQMFADVSDEEIKIKAGYMQDGLHMATPAFDGAQEEEIVECLTKAGLPISGQVILYDGRTGEPFDHPITVGIMYMMKLHHLVDDKIHARSIGPYSLVTQQPLGGKAQFGGQRLGEMEVWAMESYGAAYSLQEFLTVKSDDVAGRTRMYEKIVKGNNFLEAGLPESFNVLVKELQSLGLEVELNEDGEPEVLLDYNNKS